MSELITSPEISKMYGISIYAVRNKLDKHKVKPVKKSKFYMYNLEKIKEIFENTITIDENLVTLNQISKEFDLSVAQIKLRFEYEKIKPITKNKVGAFLYDRTIVTDVLSKFEDPILHIKKDKSLISIPQLAELYPLNIETIRSKIKQAQIKPVKTWMKLSFYKKDECVQILDKYEEKLNGNCGVINSPYYLHFIAHHFVNREIPKSIA